jgi:hypothetical protein
MALQSTDVASASGAAANCSGLSRRLLARGPAPQPPLPPVRSR